MPRLYVFELPDGSTQLHLRADPPAVGMTLALLGRDYVIVTVRTTAARWSCGTSSARRRARGRSGRAALRFRHGDLEARCPRELPAVG